MKYQNPSFTVSYGGKAYADNWEATFRKSDGKEKGADQEATPVKELRCRKTGNLCGTDTWAENYICPCQSCQLMYSDKTT